MRSARAGAEFKEVHEGAFYSESEALRERLQFQILRRKAHGRNFPNREVPRALGVNLPKTLNTLFVRYKQWFTREEVSPGPGVAKCSNRKAVRA